MRIVTCPDCKQEGKVPDEFVGRRIKCSRCGGRFLVMGFSAASPPSSGQAAKGAGPEKGPPLSSPNLPTFEGIAIEGGEENSWNTLGVTSNEEPTVPWGEPLEDRDPEPQDAEPPGDGMEYKLLTPKDKVFDNQFDLARLESVINAHAKKGWAVRSMTTAPVATFTGGVREELIVLLERTKGRRVTA